MCMCVCAYAYVRDMWVMNILCRLLSHRRSAAAVSAIITTPPLAATTTTTTILAEGCIHFSYSLKLVKAALPDV